MLAGMRENQLDAFLSHLVPTLLSWSKENKPSNKAAKMFVIFHPINPE